MKNMYVLSCILIVTTCISGLNSQDLYRLNDTILSEIEIWSGKGPGSEALSITETVTNRSLVGDCTIDRAITLVTVPTITPLLPDTPNGAAVIICPGGAYQRVVYDVEGMGVGQWLNTLDITAFVLKYRLPADNHVDNKYVPMQDIQRAVRYVKYHASEWGLDTSKIGIAGASAGGHVAAMHAVAYDKQVYTAIDTIDSISAKPYFMFLLYPVVSMETSITHIGSRDLLLGTSPTQELIDEFSAEKHVSDLCPKSFFALAQDDNGVSIENSKRFHRALRDSGVVSKIMIYSNGGHGRGICKAVGYDFANWPKDCAKWLDSLGLAEYIEVPEEPEEPEEPENINNLKGNQRNFMLYPNPVQENTLIRYKVSEVSSVQITLYDITGKQIKVLLNENKIPGEYTLSLDSCSKNLKGLFLVRFSDGTSILEKKVIF